MWSGIEIGELWSYPYIESCSTSGETRPMSIQAHLAELEKRHQALEQEITEAMAYPSKDDLKIAELKRRKLLVKDEIARLQHEASVH